MALFRGCRLVSLLAAYEAGQNKAEAFTAGLLHDIGKLVLAATEREAYASVIRQGKSRGRGRASGTRRFCH